jgi:hypothetical protein
MTARLLAAAAMTFAGAIAAGAKFCANPVAGSRQRRGNAARQQATIAIRMAVVFSMFAAVVACGGNSGSADAGAQTPPAASPPAPVASPPPTVVTPSPTAASPPPTVAPPPPTIASPPSTAGPPPATPPSDAHTAALLPAVVEAEDFDAGGEGIGYHDNTVANVGGLYRPGEGVDIIAGPDGADSFVVDNFETGEWLAYTIDVPVAGNYVLALYAASAFNDSAYHVEIDGFDTTGSLRVANTGSWSSFQWTVPWIVGLPAGRHVLKIVADQQYFDLDSFRVEIPEPSSGSSLSSLAPQPPSVPLPDPSAVAFSCSFVGAVFDCGLEEQAELPGRAEFTSVARDGSKGIRLHTEPGDNNVASSGEMERDDLWLSQAASDGYEGREAWWAHSIYFPDDFTVPTWESYVVFDFHNSGPGPWQANFHVAFEGQADSTQPGLLSLIGYGGVNSGDGRFDAVLGQVQKNVWYDFVYHVRWSSGPDGFFDAWVNGKRVLAHQGPTLYAGQGVYLKLANYHDPVCDPYPACIGKHKASSVIHDRVIRANAPEAVSSGPLEGVLDLVNGVLTPVLP